jgi:hypothetical protein
MAEDTLALCRELIEIDLEDFAACFKKIAAIDWANVDLVSLVQAEPYKGTSGMAMLEKILILTCGLSWEDASITPGLFWLAVRYGTELHNTTLTEGVEGETSPCMHYVCCLVIVKFLLPIALKHYVDETPVPNPLKSVVKDILDELSIYGYGYPDYDNDNDAYLEALYEFFRKCSPEYFTDGNKKDLFKVFFVKTPILA